MSFESSRRVTSQAPGRVNATTRFLDRDGGDRELTRVICVKPNLRLNQQISAVRPRAEYA
jgi:hypothetical protein